MRGDAIDTVPAFEGFDELASELAPEPHVVEGAGSSLLCELVVP